MGEFQKSLKHCSTIIKSLQAKVVASRKKLIIYTGECKERGHDFRCCAGYDRFMRNKMFTGIELKGFDQQISL